MKNNILNGTRAYLSGPMDFVGSRIIEKYLGWRAILTPILHALGVAVLDPWNKPSIRGHGAEYGREGILPNKAEYEKDFWTNAATRTRFETDFWETVHIDCRMTDVSDFLISFAPTNIYSVGTVHEIVLARNQFKPVLFVSPPIKYEFFPELHGLDPAVKNLLQFYGLKENPEGIPSQWYGNIVGGHNMFDGFGWENLKFKAEGFYPALIREVVEISRPSAGSSGSSGDSGGCATKDEMRIWKSVAAWVKNHAGLQKLQGGVLDHAIPADKKESAMLKKAVATSREEAREFFWYNSPYCPRRPMLYQLFLIASGHIPPRAKVVNAVAEGEKVERISCKAVDDDWLLINSEK